MTSRNIYPVNEGPNKKTSRQPQARFARHILLQSAMPLSDTARLALAHVLRPIYVPFAAYLLKTVAWRKRALVCNRDRRRCGRVLSACSASIFMFERVRRIRGPRTNMVVGRFPQIVRRKCGFILHLQSRQPLRQFRAASKRRVRCRGHYSDCPLVERLRSRYKRQTWRLCLA